MEYCSLHLEYLVSEEKLQDSGIFKFIYEPHSEQQAQ